MKKRVIFRAIGAGVAATAVVATAVVAKKVVGKLKKEKQVPEYTVEPAEQAEQVAPDYYAAVKNAYDGGPNANPVYSPKVETPRTEDGKIDVMKLVSPEDFYNWEEHGCQS